MSPKLRQRWADRSGRTAKERSKPQLLIRRRVGAEDQGRRITAQEGRIHGLTEAISADHHAPCPFATGHDDVPEPVGARVLMEREPRAVGGDRNGPPTDVCAIFWARRQPTWSTPIEIGPQDLAIFRVDHSSDRWVSDRVEALWAVVRYIRCPTGSAWLRDGSAPGPHALSGGAGHQKSAKELEPERPHDSLMVSYSALLRPAPNPHPGARSGALWVVTGVMATSGCADLFSDAPPAELLLSVAEDQSYYLYGTEGNEGGYGGLPLLNVWARIPGRDDQPVAADVHFAWIFGVTARWRALDRQEVWWPGLAEPLPVGSYPSFSENGATTYWDMDRRALVLLSPARCTADGCRPVHLLNEVDFARSQLSADARWVIVGVASSTGTDTLAIINTDNGQVYDRVESTFDDRSEKLGAFAPDGSSVVFLDRPGEHPRLRAYEFSRRQLAEWPRLPPGWIVDHAFLDAERMSVIVAPRDEAGYLLATVSPSRIEERRRFSGASKLEFLAEGRLLLESSFDAEYRPVTRIFDLRRPDAPPTVLEDFGRIADVAPDGSRIAYFHEGPDPYSAWVVSVVSFPDGARASISTLGTGRAFSTPFVLYDAETLVYLSSSESQRELHLYQRGQDTLIATGVVTAEVARNPGRIYYTVEVPQEERSLFGRIETYDLSQ